MPTYKLEEFGLEVEIGTYAQQAAGAAWLKQEGAVVLSTVCTAKSEEFPGFLPLSVDYREQFSAVGKIPGGYFKREGRATERETLTSRLIDRAIRPLFPENYFDQLQVITTVYSANKKSMPNILGLLASSIALTISPIPFLGPIGAAEVVRINGDWIINPNFEQYTASDSNIIFAGTKEGVCMVEGSTSEISEEDFLHAMSLAHDAIKKQVIWQEQIKTSLNIIDEKIVNDFDWQLWEKNCDQFFSSDRLKTVFKSDKVERSTAIKVLKDDFFAHFSAHIEEQKLPVKKIDYIFENMLKNKLTDLFFSQGHRVDGRAFNQVRAISTKVGLLPDTHGSAFFMRGRTQALATVTLGGGKDQLAVEGLIGPDLDKRFFLHYNFPPFSVGEVRPMRGPGRREIGHGNLAAVALKRVLPDSESFPYTIRIVADMLESDGSTSMATICSSTMALLNAGVKISNMVSGVAMGLLRSSDGKFQALTDISGFEDAFGLMDFKVAGTSLGITAIQMDIKYKGGLVQEVFAAALAQAKEGRAHILKEMQKVMDKPNVELSPLVPKIYTVKIPKEKIGAVIGQGGKNIKEIIEKSGTQIDIEDDGTVNVLGGPEANIDLALNWIRTLSGLIEAGSIYEGKIRRLADFGLFVELVPGVDGLLHISNIARDKQRTFHNDYHIDDIVTVEVVDYDPQTDRIRLKFASPKKN